MLECQLSSNSVRTLGFSDLSGIFWYACKWEIVLFEVSMKGMATVSIESSVYKTFLVLQFQQLLSCIRRIRLRELRQYNARPSCCIDPLLLASIRNLGLIRSSTLLAW